jgi:hypothetical protein
MEAFTADALATKIDLIERIDRLIAIAESRRNASLTRSNGVRHSSAMRYDGGSW